ncbi:hypothetical protein WDH52_12835 [Streptomyces sp. TRM70308]|uniref:SCO4225 family membrane protein n=1 Tax=Streptomyces sp. TRM70308 TaxID=3131932 RepID=UPI003D081BDE
MPSTSRPRRVPRLRRLLGLAAGSRLARGYLAVVVASVPASFVFPDSPVLLFLNPLILTAPLSFLSLLLPFGPGTEGSGAVEVLATGWAVLWTLLCALVNAAVLGALTARSAPAASRGAREPLPRRSAQQGPGLVRPAHPRLRRVRAQLAPAVDNRLARGYLAVVAASLGFFLSVVYLSPDPGFAGIWPLMATAPLSVVAFLLASPDLGPSLAWLNPLLFTAGTALSGLINAVLIGRLAHKLRPREAGPAA